MYAPPRTKCSRIRRRTRERRDLSPATKSQDNVIGHSLSGQGLDGRTKLCMVHVAYIRPCGRARLGFVVGGVRRLVSYALLMRFSASVGRRHLSSKRRRHSTFQEGGTSVVGCRRIEPFVTPDWYRELPAGPGRGEQSQNVLYLCTIKADH